MSHIKQQRSPLSKDGVPRETQKQRALVSLPDTFMGLVPTLQETIGWSYNAVLTGVSFRINRGVWSAVIKADFGNTARVAYLDVGSFGRCVEVCCEFAEKRMLTWQHDKYPPRERRVRLPGLRS